MTALYRLAPDASFRRLDDEVAVYLAASFETHLLDDAGGQVVEALQALQQGAIPASVVALAGWLTSDQDTAIALSGVPFGEPDLQALQHAQSLLQPVLAELTRIGVTTLVT